MNTQLLPAPHRPPLIQIKHKRFMMLNCKYVYPLIYTKNEKLNVETSSDLSRVNFLTAPYYHDNDIYNVYVSYMSEKKAKNMIRNIKDYYDLDCDAIKMLREDMEYYSEIMNTPLVVIRNHKLDIDIYELSYKDKKRL
jgi:hypothetical protein